MTVLPAGNQTAGRLTAAQLCSKHPRKACALKHHYFTFPRLARYESLRNAPYPFRALDL